MNDWEPIFNEVYNGIEYHRSIKKSQKNLSLLAEEEFDYFLAGHCDKSEHYYYEFENLDKPTSPEFIAVYAVLIFGGVVLNLLVLVTTFSRNRWRTVTNTFIVSLSLGDFLLATVIIPVRINERFLSKSFVEMRIIYPCIGAITIFSLSCLTLDRYLNIMHAMDYDGYMNKSRAAVLIASCWIFSILQSCIYFLIHESDRYKKAIYNDVRGILCFALPAILNCVVYAKLFVIAKRHSRHIAVTSTSIPHSHPLPLRQDTKLLTIVVFLVGTFIVCWFPFLFAVCYELHHEKSELSKSFCLFKDISECILMSTCVINPITCGLFRRDIRQRESVEEIELN
ncbi:histamine H2 receptor-like [Dendronephthya gigantea]|uniref:histamine H2 receptor-like n=1 Tax=Dendronephthya gigantea TaxID=151771 RepID=UPI00106C8F3E|nr:histamine H2 receptor-like [Dendronephthya gigantea]